MTAAAPQSPPLLRVTDIDGDVLELREGYPDKLSLWVEPVNGHRHVALIFEPDTVAEISDAFNAWLAGGRK